MGEVEKKLNKSIETTHRRLDRIENESLKRRGSTQSSCDQNPNHEFRTLREEMDLHRALRLMRNTKALVMTINRTKGGRAKYLRRVHPQLNQFVHLRSLMI